MSSSLTVLLEQWRAGDRQALDEMMPLVYAQLRSLAGSMMRSERADHTLRPTAVVHEAYLRLKDSNAAVTDRAHFFAIAAGVMRHVLLDWARGRTREKRGGGALHETLEDSSAVTISAEPETILEIDRLLTRMQSFDERKVRIVEMIFFGGMTYDETAEVLSISAVTVHRELKMAKAWMRSELAAPAARGEAL